MRRAMREEERGTRTEYQLGLLVSNSHSPVFHVFSRVIIVVFMWYVYTCVWMCTICRGRPWNVL